MTDRNVTVRLRLDASQWQTGARQAQSSTTQLAAGAQAAAADAERAAQRTAAAITGTFTAGARAGQAALADLNADATRSSAALARTSTAMTRQTAQAATAANRTILQGTTATTAATRQVAAAADGIPAAFRAAATAGTTSLGRLDLATATTTQQMARMALANRQAVTAAAASLGQLQTGMSASTAAAAAGINRISLANRLALGEAGQASRAASAAAAAAAARTSTAASLAASGATRASAAAAAAAATADARAAAASTGLLASVSAKARALGATVTTAAAESETGLKGVRTASLVLVAAFAGAVYGASKFETAMSGVRAATDASASDLDRLRQAAIQAGSTTQFSATEAADAETELAKAGVSTNDILGGALKGTLSLASAGQMSVADSAVVAAKAMNSFGLSGSDMAHIADVIAAAAGKSATDVHGMSLAFAQSALLAHQTGLTLEQTAGALALFAQNGLEGSDAGTSLKTMLMRLTPQSQQARDLMTKLGFSAYDANGKFVGLAQVADRMQKSFGNLTPEARNAAMGIIFGSDATRAATVIYKAGATGINQWTAAANDQGYASRYAATQTDNLAGDLQRLKSALETAFIQSGTAANSVLRDMAQDLTGVIRWYSQLPSGVQQSATILAGFVGVVGLAAASLLLFLPRIQTVRRELVSLGLTAERTNALMTGLGRLSIVVGVLAAISYATNALDNAMAPAAPNVTKLTDSLVDFARRGDVAGEAASAFGSNLGDLDDALQQIAHPTTLERIDNAGYSILHLGDAAPHLDDARTKVNALDQSLADLVQSGSPDIAAQAFDRIAASAEKSGTSTNKLRGMLPQYTAALAAADTQTKLAGSSQATLGTNATTTTADLEDQETAAQKLSDTLTGLDGNAITAAQSQISFRQSLADLTTAVKDNGHSLDTATTKGRAVKSAFLDAAKAAQDHAQAVTQQTNSVTAGDKVFDQDIAALKRQMTQLGFNKTAIKDLLGTYAQLPDLKVTTVTAVTTKAETEIAAVQKKLQDTHDKTITVGALDEQAIAALEAVGFKVDQLKDKQIRITAPPGQVESDVAAAQRAINQLHGQQVINQVVTKYATSGHDAGGGRYFQANGAVMRFAVGGIEQHVAQVAPAGAMRLWAEPETGGEAYIPLATAKRARSTAILDVVARQFGYRLQRYATGGVAAFAAGGFTYTPSDPTTTLGPDAGMDRYNTAVSAVNSAGKTLASALTAAAKAATTTRDAEANLSKVRSEHHTAAQLTAAEERLTKARQAQATADAKVTTDRKSLNSADSALGVKAGTKSIGAFNLGAYEKQLAAANTANAAWEANLASVGKRAGADVEDTLRNMGSDGTALVAALAKASGKTFSQIVAQLKALAPTAQATLADYTRQMNTATSASATFQQNLLKLAAQGDTALANQLAGQGDDAAAAIAAQAVSSPGSASTANTAAAGDANLLSGDDLTNALSILTALRSGPGQGLAQLMTSTGLDLPTIEALLPKVMGQIQALPPADSQLIMQQWAALQAGKPLSFRHGGIRADGANVVRFAERGTGGEAYIPLGAGNRVQSTGILAHVASLFGYQLTPAGAPAASGVTHNTRHQEIHLHGAKQTGAEQVADIARRLAFAG